MKCSQLKIKAIKSKPKKDVIKYKKQHKLVVKLKKHFKKGFFINLETKNNSKPFWLISKPYFSSKQQKIIILLDNRKIANVFNKIIT